MVRDADVNQLVMDNWWLYICPRSVYAKYSSLSGHRPTTRQLFPFSLGRQSVVRSHPSAHISGWLHIIDTVASISLLRLAWMLCIW